MPAISRTLPPSICALTTWADSSANTRACSACSCSRLAQQRGALPSALQRALIRTHLLLSRTPPTCREALVAPQTKALRAVEIKDASQGLIQAVFSTFDVIDRDGDVTRKSAFKDGA